jgi:hypothetical protein
MASVQSIREAILILVAERQALRDREADCRMLEANRLDLGRLQRELSDALIESHLHGAVAI